MHETVPTDGERGSGGEEEQRTEKQHVKAEAKLGGNGVAGSTRRHGHRVGWRAHERGKGGPAHGAADGRADEGQPGGAKPGDRAGGDAMHDKEGGRGGKEGKFAGKGRGKKGWQGKSQEEEPMTWTSRIASRYSSARFVAIASPSFCLLPSSPARVHA